MFIFGVIPARGGSKGLPGKNLKLLGGKPLIAWTIEAAKLSRRLSETIVSTDDPAIAAAAKEYGGEAPFLRPAELATDSAGMAGVVQHAVRWLEKEKKVKPDLIVLLQPTSPLRTAGDIDEAIALIEKTGADSVSTVTEDKQHPWHRYLLDDARLIALHPDASKKYPRRQDAPPVYRPSGAIDVVRYDVVMETGLFQGTNHRALVRDWRSSIDIDEAWDLKLAELALKEPAP